VQLVLDADKLGEQLSEFLVPIMGPWHVYKMASCAVWKRAGPPFLIRFFYHLFPSATWYESARLPIVSSVMSFLRLAWTDPTNADWVNEFRKDVKNPDAMQVDAKFPKGFCKNHAKNLVHLMDDIIPKVSAA